MSGDADSRVRGLDDLLGRLDRILGRAVERVVQAFGAQVDENPFRGLYITEHDATRLSANPRISPILGAAEGEAPLAEVLDPGSELAELARAYGLSGFDLEVVGVALAPEVDVAYERLYGFLQDDVSRRRPCVDLVLNLLCPSTEAKLARRAHFATDSPLVRHELIEILPEPTAVSPPLLARLVRVDDAVVRHLLGERGLDASLCHSFVLLDVAVGPRREPPVLGDDLDGLGALVAAAQAHRDPLRLYFSGPSEGAKRQAAAALAASAAAPLLAGDIADVLAAEDGARRTRLLFREARLRGAIVYLDRFDALDDGERREVIGALTDHAGVAIVAGTESRPPRGRGVEGIVDVPFAVPGHAQRVAFWQQALQAAAVDVPAEDVDALAGRFRFTSDQISDAVSAARYAGLRRDAGASTADLFAAARTRSETGLESAARKIQPVHDWEQIVLPPDALAQLRELCQQIVERHQVLDCWGFGRRLSLGKGVSALFAGPSGTGKTMAAEIIARELELDLYKVDLAGVVSKYIGETEKNLARIFAAAENANAILFFDEADALFGKRSEVRDSHDRYANIEIAYLLQQMEHYEGVAILATNLRQNMDEAFVRRLHFVIEFPFPDEEQRARIWPLLFPAEAERDAAIDFDLLARQFRITGGSIKNIVLGAAYLAAGERRPIGTDHLVRAVRREHHKLGKVVTAAALEPFRELVGA